MTVHSFPAEAVLPFPPLHLVEELNHRVLNEYSEAILALSVVAETVVGPAQEALHRAMGRLSAHVAAHRALQPPTGARRVNLADYLGSLCARLSDATLADNCVRLTLTADEVWLDPGQCWRIGLIVAELIRNAARHGLAGGPGAVGVRLVARGDTLACCVHDKGGAATAAAPGRGLRLAQSIADELGGTIASRFTETGSMVGLLIPCLSVEA